MKYIRKVLACLRKADEKYALIDDNDKIVLGISGGKDSLCLLKAMSIYGKFSNKKFKIYPVCLDLGFIGFDGTKLKEYASSLGLELTIVDCKEVYPILIEHQKEGSHLPCSICGRMRKAAINLYANKIKANKVAFAHHKDDAIETLFMNMIHGGRVATFEPKMYLSKADITFIRPLIECSEMDLIGMAKEENLPVMKRICPSDGFTEREFIKNYLKNLYSQRENAKYNFAEMLSNYDSFKLYFDCLETTSNRNHELSFRKMSNRADFYSFLNLVKKSKGQIKENITNGETLLLKKNHESVGNLTYRYISKHTIEISSFQSLKEISEEEKKEYLILFIENNSKKILPCSFIYKERKNKKIALELGFETKANINGYSGLTLKTNSTHPF